MRHRTREIKKENQSKFLALQTQQRNNQDDEYDTKNARNKSKQKVILENELNHLLSKK